MHRKPQFYKLDMRLFTKDHKNYSCHRFIGVMRCIPSRLLGKSKRICFARHLQGESLSFAKDLAHAGKSLGRVELVTLQPKD